jgi:hypothetical protein
MAIFNSYVKLPEGTSILIQIPDPHLSPRACTAQSTAPGMFHPFGGCTDCGRFPQGIGMALERWGRHKKMRHPKYHGEI